jgi:predicted ATP-grasp superfamily ATP-dependent carboligase
MPCPGQISILLLDGHSPASLAFTRSLAPQGIRVTVGAASPDAPTRFSRFCTQFLLYPSPMKDPEGFRQWLFDILSHCQFDLLIGTTDQTLPLLDEWRELLSPRVRVPLPARAGFRLACDKAKTAKQATEWHFPRSPGRGQVRFSVHDAGGFSLERARLTWADTSKQRRALSNDSLFHQGGFEGNVGART